MPITGTINRVKTMADQTVRIEIDIPLELCPTDIITWQYEEVTVTKKGVKDAGG